MPRIIPQWSQTAALMLAAQVRDGARFWLNCTGCGTREALNLPAIILKEGGSWSPWERRPPCPTCGRQMLLNGQPSEGTPVIPFIGGDPVQVAELHRAWLREKRRLG